ncbi:MAG: hypothetical protein IPM42_19820 [Saprospiraceae bacterium]|nr:hypothetical protein [Saprospiraceae bacterium]
MPNYKIKIKPLEYYFFGGEKHNEEFEANYFVESLDYPQQTTLLGMIRYFLLQENNMLGGKSLSKEIQDDAKILIGEQSFKYGAEFKFGKITNLSPLYFSKENDEDYFFAPLDVQFKMDDDFILSKNNVAYNAKDFSKEIKQSLYSTKSKPIAISEIIKDIKQVGNKKGEKGVTEDKAFYKQNMKKLEEDWSFCVDAEIDVELEQKEYFIPFGGEKCFFKLTLKQGEAVHPSYPSAHQRKQPSILCISDCFIDGNKVKHLPFAVTDFVSFRNFRSKLNTSNHYAFKKEQDIETSMVRSSRYQLLKRGSILYFSDQNSRDLFANEIESDTCSKIGFNKTLKN